MGENGGDRELVLGTKQLLAIFFVGALLCGVFFAVGYVVGSNSAKSSALAASDSTSAPVSEGKREEPHAASDGGASVTPASLPSDGAGTIPGAEPHMADNPAAAGSAPPVTAAAIPPAPAPAPQTTAPPKSTAVAPTATGIALSVPEKGASYVQIAAIPRPRADDMVKSLREAKLPAILAESSKPELSKVLVGPYHTPLAVHDAKQKLTELGFNGLIVIKP
jgi:hypothetical protein